MMNKELLPETEFLFLGQVTDLQEFTDEYCDGNLETAKGAIEILIKKGKVVFNESSTRQENVLKSAAKEEVIKGIVEQFEEDEETIDKFQKAQKREDRGKYESIELPFATLTDAQATENFVKNKFFLETRIEIQGKQFILVVFDITDAEVNAIGRKFQLENLVDTSVGLVNKGVHGLAGAVDFAASKVLVPTFKVGATTGVAVTKTAVNTIAKTGSVLVSSIIRGSKQAKNELIADREILSAVDEIIQTKDSIMRGFGKLFNGSKATGSIKINK